MKTSKNGINFIIKNEVCRLKAYQDIRGIWTIGYGWTGMVDNRFIGKDTTITINQAETFLELHLITIENCINSKVKVKLNQNQFDALVDFIYNTGIYAFTSSTLLKVLNEGDYNAAAVQFLAWNKPIQLLKRRESEKALFLS